jgi:hypothetical protein
LVGRPTNRKNESLKLFLDHFFFFNVMVAFSVFWYGLWYSDEQDMFCSMVQIDLFQWVAPMPLDCAAVLHMLRCYALLCCAALRFTLRCPSIPRRAVDCLRSQSQFRVLCPSSPSIEPRPTNTPGAPRGRGRLDFERRGRLPSCVCGM